VYAGSCWQHTISAVTECPSLTATLQVYESSMRQPLGRQYVPDSSFRNLTRPAVLKNTGVMIEPLRFSAPVAKYNSSGDAKDRRVVTVSGGMQQRTKK
jgi:U3 small nucleolar RNA-associated protein 14